MVEGNPYVLLVKSGINKNQYIMDEGIIRQTTSGYSQNMAEQKLHSEQHQEG